MFTPKVLVVNVHAAGLSAPDSLLLPDHGSNAYELMSAASREEALRQVREHEFAVILLNAGTPGIDCPELAEAIHSQPHSASVPIIFIGACLSDETDELKGYQKGAVDYLFAPVIPQILQAKVSLFIELARKNLQLQRQARETAELNQALQLQRKHDLQYIAERQQVEAAL
ncbi:MAG TPA: response regulator, partial [Burkholderiaceae bacterium]|nr:response regulator [Burkholderiaceae bacterium]